MQVSAAEAGFVLGIIPGVAADLEVFKTWKKWDAVVSYDWKTALVRWVAYGLLGACTALGASQLPIEVIK